MNVTLPDGTVLQNVPDGTSRADLITKLKGNGYDTSQLEAMPAPAAPVAPLSTMDRIKQGLMDPWNGAAQLLTHVLPSSVVQAGNAVNNYIADKTGLVAPVPSGGLDQTIQGNEQQYQAGLAATRAGASAQGSAIPSAQAAGAPANTQGNGIDGYRLLGNAINPTNLAVASRVPAAATVLGRLAQGAVLGAGAGATAPVTQPGDFASQKLTQIGAGAAGGLATSAVAGAVGSVLSPAASTSPTVQTLLSEGVQPSIGQTLGGAANNIEQKLSSVPVLGNLVTSARTRPFAQVQTAAANRALNPVGQTAPADLTGSALVDHVGSTLSNGYDALLPQMATQGDSQLFNEIGSVQNMMANGSIDPAKATQFNNLLQNQVLSKFQPGANGAPTITGQTLKDIQSDLGQLSSKFGSSTDPDQMMVGNALDTVRSSLLDNAKRSNPGLADNLNQLDTGYANFKRLQRAASGIGTDDGNFSPAQLQSAVRALDPSKDKSAFASGNALMQDLSGAAKSVLGTTVPDSGTAGRAMLAAGIGGAALEGPHLLSLAMAHPALTSAAALSPLIYSPWGQALIRNALTARPSFAQPIANALQQATPSLIPAGAFLGTQVTQ